MAVNTPSGITELIALAKQGDRSACERLIVENSGLIWSIARRFFGRGVDADDLYQLGCLGFLKAVAGFDTEFGTQFSTYAVPKICGEIRRFLRDDGAVKVSRGLKERANSIRGVRDRLSQKLGRDPALSEISFESGLTPEEIAVAETASAAVESLQRENRDDGFTLESALGVTGMEENIIERLSLREAVSRLPERERTVIHLRFFRGLTQEKAARILKISQVQVSRVERRAIAMLRDSIA